MERQRSKAMEGEIVGEINERGTERRKENRVGGFIAGALHVMSSCYSQIINLIVSDYVMF